MARLALLNLVRLVLFENTRILLSTKPITEAAVQEDNKYTKYHVSTNTLLSYFFCYFFICLILYY